MQVDGDKENVSVNQAALYRSPMRGKKPTEAGSACEAESCTVDHDFVVAMLAAVKAAQVRRTQLLIPCSSLLCRTNVLRIPSL